MSKTLLGAAAALGLLAAMPTKADPFTFMAIGDMPYGSAEKAYPPYEALLGTINTLDPAPLFTVHVGDIKSGRTVCSDEEFQTQLDFMNSLNHPVLYTPGDNEWTDCHRKNAGGMDPLERLAKLREMYFAAPKTVGGKPLPVERQSDLQLEHATYVENMRFTMNHVMVVSAHVVGSNNNFEIRDPKAVEEFFARDAANIAWVRDSFAKATQENAAAVVLAIHADVFNAANRLAASARYSGFHAFIPAFLEAAVAFGKPVLLIHGDSHVFVIDRPFKDGDGKVIANVTRLEVFGDQEVNGVLVSVDPQSPGVFGFTPVYGGGELTQ